jgi:hypothetical protein
MRVVFITEAIEQIFITKMVTKQASAFCETFTESVTRIKAANNHGVSIVRKAKPTKNVIKSGSTNTQEIMTHDPCLTSITQERETNKHAVYIINRQTRKKDQKRILNAIIRIVVPPERTHLMNTSRQWTSNDCLSGTLEVDPQGRFVVIPPKKHRHITLQVSTVHHDQADVVYVEEEEWCIKETATATSIEKTQNISSKSTYKPRLKGVVTNVKGTPQQLRSKSEDNLDEDLHHCTWNSKLIDDKQSNTKNEGIFEYKKAISNHSQHWKRESDLDGDLYASLV